MSVSDLVFLDDNRRLVPPAEATFMVATEVDRHDRVVRERWYRYPTGSLRMETVTLDADHDLAPADTATYRVETIVGPGDTVIHEKWVALGGA